MNELFLPLYLPFSYLAFEMLSVSAATASHPLSSRCPGYKLGVGGVVAAPGVRLSPGLCSSKNTQGSHNFFLFFFCSPLLTLLPLVRHEVAPLTADPLLCCQPVCSSLHVHISPPRTQPLPKLYRSYSHCHHKVTQAAEPLPLPHPDFFFLGLSQKGRERCLLGFIRPLRLRH